MQTVLNLIDTVMVGRLGEVQIGAIALGNQVYLLIVLFLFGVGSGAAVFASQYWGRKDIAGLRRSLGVSLLFGLAGAALFTIAAMAIPGPILSIFTNDDLVIREGVGYLRIVAPSYLFTAVTVSYSSALRSIGRTKLPMYATAISIAINVVGNALLIFGNLGFPALGVAGAAVATSIARLIEMCIVLIAVYRRSGPVAARFTELFAWDRSFLVQFTKRSVPVIFNDLFWSLGFTMYTVVFGRLGTEYLATYNISDTIGRLTLVLFIGTAQAAQIVIGNDIGADRLDDARIKAGALLRFTPIASALMGALLFFPVAALVPYGFEISEESRIILRDFLRLFALLIIMKVVNLHIIVGILRGGADTHRAFMIDVLPLWLVGVPLAFFIAFVLQAPPLLAYTAFFVEEILRLVFGLGRVKSGKWIHSIVDHSLLR